MIQLTKSGMTGQLNHSALTDQFQHSHVFRIEKLLDAELIDQIYSRLDNTNWETRKDGTIASEALPAAVAPAGVLDFVTNTAEFLETIRSITGLDEITFFSGRVYKMLPIAEHYDSWHSDLTATNSRLLGMSINLSQAPYEGGAFRLYDERKQEIVCELENTSLGDAIFFRIAPYLKHMVTALQGQTPKIAYAGWFQSGPTTFYSTLLDHQE